MRRLLSLALLTITASAHAQHQVVQPAPCGANTTPVVAIAIQYHLGAAHGWDFTEALDDALVREGFRTYTDASYPQVEEATIRLEGTVDDSKGLSGTSSTRVGNARLDVVDVDSRQVILTLAQQQAGFVFSAPTLTAFAGMVVKEVKARYCQLH